MCVPLSYHSRAVLNAHFFEGSLKLKRRRRSSYDSTQTPFAVRYELARGADAAKDAKIVDPLYVQCVSENESRCDA